MSAIKMEPNVHTDPTFWMKIYGGMSAIEMKPRRHRATH